MRDAAGQHHYREADARSATPEKLLVLLYDKLVRDLEEARRAHRAGDAARSVDRVHHARLIVTELAQALDPQQDPDLATDLASVYEFFLHETALYLADRDTTRLDHCLKVIGPLRAAWAEAADHVPGTAPAAGPEAETAANSERPANLFSVSA